MLGEARGGEQEPDLHPPSTHPPHPRSPVSSRETLYGPRPGICLRLAPAAPAAPSSASLPPTALLLAAAAGSAAPATGGRWSTILKRSGSTWPRTSRGLRDSVVTYTPSHPHLQAGQGGAVEGREPERESEARRRVDGLASWLGGRHPRALRTGWGGGGGGAAAHLAVKEPPPTYCCGQDLRGW